MNLFLRSLHLRPVAGPSGFTLIELIVVVVIMVVVLSFVAPAVTSSQEGNNLVLGGQTVADELAFARQYAASRNQTVQVRFITPSGSAYKGYTGIQLWKLTTTGTSALDQLYQLPAGMEISANATLSPIVSTNGLAGAPYPMPTGGGMPGTYVAFTVRPDGNVLVPNPPTLSNAGNFQNGSFISQPSYYLTVQPERYDTASTLPKNYVTIQVNPDTGRTQIFRP
jgi:uncharacterized protein (TIGR02596 family)